MIQLKRFDNKIEKDIELGGDYDFPYNIYLGAYRRDLKRGDYQYASRAWKKVILFSIISKKIFDILKEKEEVIIADLGCGNCYLLSMLESNFVEYPNKKIKYYGIDLKESALLSAYDKLKDKIKKIDAVLILHNLLNGIPLDDKSVDIAVCLEVIKYWDYEDVYRFFNEVKRVLRDSGLFFLSTQGIFANKDIDLNEYLNKSKEKGIKNAFYISNFMKILENKGFEVLDIISTEGNIKNVRIYDEYKKLFDYIPDEILEAVFGILDKSSHSKLFILKKK